MYELLVEEIVVEDDEAIIRGSYAGLVNTLHQMKMGTSVSSAHIHT